MTVTMARLGLGRPRASPVQVVGLKGGIGWAAGAELRHRLVDCNDHCEN